MRWSQRPRAAQIVAGAAVFAGLYMGLALAFRECAPDGSFSPVFPPAGIMFSLFIVGGIRWLPVALLVRVVTISLWFDDADQSATSVLVEAVLISTPYALCAEFLRRGRLERAHPPEFAWFIGVGVVLAPTVATLGLCVQRMVESDVSFADALTDLRVFWVGDALAIASITPLTLVLMQTLLVGRPRPRVRLSFAQRTEYALMVLAVAGAPLASSIFVSRGGPPALVVVTTLPLLWVALRQDLLQTAIGIAVSVLIISIGLRRARPFDELVEVQYLLLCGTVAALFAAAVRRANEALTASLRVEQGRSRQIEGHAPLYITELSVTGSRRNGSSDDDDAVALVHADVEGRWLRFGPSVLRQRDIVPFSWDSGGSPNRSFDSVAVPIESPIGDIDHVLVVTTDRTEVRRAAETVRRVETHDVETGLVNRREFHRLVDESASRIDGVLGVAAIAFHDVVEVVDASSAGPTSTELTAEIARRVSSRVGDGGEVGRLGDHSLGLFAWETASAPGGLSPLQTLADGILTDLANADDPIPRIPISSGLSEGAATASETLERAEIAARAARELGGDRVLAFHPALHATRRRRSFSIEELRRGCDRREFQAYYQPVIRLSDRSLAGVEALVRWWHPERGVLVPERFVPDAERSGVIVRIDDLVVDTVAGQVARWVDDRVVDDRFSASFNISPLHFADPELLGRLRAVAERVDPGRLAIEVTESTAMSDPEWTVDVLTAVRDLGFTVILDDFGTGYSSMSWLHRFPAQVLKIDREFVRDVATAADSRRIVDVMVSLATDLGLSTTAEGIETAEQADLLGEIGCEFGQGFFLGAPVPASDLFRPAPGSN